MMLVTIGFFCFILKKGCDKKGPFVSDVYETQLTFASYSGFEQRILKQEIVDEHFPKGQDKSSVDGALSLRAPDKLFHTPIRTSTLHSVDSASNFHTEGKMINLIENNKNSVILEDSKEWEESRSFQQ